MEQKNPRIKRNTVINDIENEELKMPDSYSIHIMQKISWIKRLYLMEVAGDGRFGHGHY